MRYGIKKPNLALGGLMVAACVVGLLPAARCQSQDRAAAQIFNLVLDPANLALRVEASSGGAAPTSILYTTDQLLNLVLDPTESALRIECVTGCSSTSGAFTAGGDLQGTSVSQTVVGLQGRPLSGVAPATGQALEWNGSAWIPTTLSVESLPASWAINAATDAVTAEPISGQDAVALTLAPNTSSPTQDIFDVCSAIASNVCSGTKYFWVAANGNIGFSGSSATYGSQFGTAAGALFLYGGLPGAPTITLDSPQLSAPSGWSVAAVSCSTGCPAADTYSVEVSYVNSAGQSLVSTAQSVTLTSDETYQVSGVAAFENATSYNVYVQQTSGNYYQQNQSSGTSQPVAIGTSYSGPAFATKGSQPPTSNTTGAEFSDVLGPSATVDGQLCVATSTVSTGEICTSGNSGNALAINPMTAVGDLIVGGTVNALGIAAPTRLAAGASGDVLTSNGAGAAPSWQAAGSGLQVGMFALTSVGTLSGTAYWWFTGAQGVTGYCSVLASCELTMPSAGTISNLEVSASVAQGSSATLEVQLFSNGSATGYDCTISSSTSSCSNTGNYQFSSGAKLEWQTIQTGTGQSMMLGWTFEITW